jgi:hypothetical protein
MWSGQDKVWLHYIKDIMAADVYSAVFLASYLRYTSMSKSYIATMEIIDLQKYKIITQKNKVRKALKERKDVPFVFPFYKN